MQKKLITAAVAATLGTGAAFTAQTASADSVTVYGQIRMEIQHYDDGATSGVRLDDTGSQSRVGVKADKDLGNGLKAVAVFEWITEACGSSGGSAGGTAGSNNNGCRQDFHTARQQFIGLQGNFGRVAFGRFNGAYKLIGGVGYDAFNATTMQARNQGGASQGPMTHNAFMDDIVEYKSPKLGMFQFTAQYGLDDPDNPQGAANTKGDINVGATVGDKNWEFGAAFSKDDDGTDGTACINAAGTGQADSCDNWKIFGKIKFGPAQIALRYEDVESGNHGAGEFMYGQIVYKVGKFDLVGTYGTFDSDTAGAGANWADTDFWALGAKYHMGKKVWSYIGYANSDRDDDTNGSNKGFAIGMHMSF